MTVRLAIALLAAASLTAASSRLGRRLFPGEERDLRAAATLLLATAILAGVITAAGAPGLLRTPAPAVLLALACAAAWALGRGAGPEGERGPRKGGPGALWIAIAAAAAAPVVGKTLQAILHAPWDGDSLDFHLPNVVSWYFSGSLGRDPLVLTTWWYPGLARIPTLAGFLVLGNDLLANLQNLPFLLLAAAGAAVLARETGAGERGAYGAAALVAATPVLTQLVGSNMDEVGIAAGAAVLAAFLARARRTRSAADYLAAGLGAGILAGSKITGIGFVAAAGGAFLALGLRPTARGALAFLLGFAGLAGYWYARLLVPLPGAEWVASAPRLPASGPLATSLLAALGNGTIVRAAALQMAKDGAVAGILGAPIALAALAVRSAARPGVRAAGADEARDPLPLLVLGALAVFLVTPQTGARPGYPEGWIPNIIGIRYALPYLVFAAALAAREGERFLGKAFAPASLAALVIALLRVGAHQIEPRVLAILTVACAGGAALALRAAAVPRIAGPLRAALLLLAAAVALAAGAPLQARRDAERERLAAERIPGYVRLAAAVPRGATVLARGIKHGYLIAGPDLGRRIRRFGPAHRTGDAVRDAEGWERTLDVAGADFVAITPRGETATAPEAISAEVPPGWPPEDTLSAASPRLHPVLEEPELHLYASKSSGMRYKE